MLVLAFSLAQLSRLFHNSLVVNACEARGGFGFSLCEQLRHVGVLLAWLQVRVGSRRTWSFSLTRFERESCPELG